MADFTIADVLAWARTKPADEAYCYTDAGNCAIAQFGRETGREYLVGIRNLTDAGYPVLHAAVAVRDNIYTPRWTFGALVKRLETLCPDLSVTQSDWERIDAYLTDMAEA